MHVGTLSHVWLFETPWTRHHQFPLSKEFRRQEHWSGCHFLFQGIFSTPGIKPASPALAGGFFTTEPSGKPLSRLYVIIKIHFYPHMNKTIWHLLKMLCSHSFSWIQNQYFYDKKVYLRKTLIALKIMNAAFQWFSVAHFLSTVPITLDCTKERI